MLEGHVRLRLETDTSPEDVGHGSTLLGESVDDRSARGSQGGLEHVAQDAEHTVEVLVVDGGGAIGRHGLPLDAGHHLSKDHKINDERRRQEGILADVEKTVQYV